jgi:hypothetical protein
MSPVFYFMEITMQTIITFHAATRIATVTLTTLTAADTLAVHGAGGEVTWAEETLSTSKS